MNSLTHIQIILDESCINKPLLHSPLFHSPFNGTQTIMEREILIIPVNHKTQLRITMN